MVIIDIIIITIITGILLSANVVKFNIYQRSQVMNYFPGNKRDYIRNKLFIKKR